MEILDRLRSKLICMNLETGQPTAATVDITPESLKTAEGRGKVATAVDEWEATHAELANAFTHFVDAYPFVFEDCASGMSGEDARQDWKELQQMMADRAKKQEAFLVALAGR